jgi:hypothetical protein
LHDRDAGGVGIVRRDVRISSTGFAIADRDVSGANHSGANHSGVGIARRDVDDDGAGRAEVPDVPG